MRTLFALLLFLSTLAAERRIDFVAPQNDPTSPQKLLADVQQALAEKKISLKPSELKGNLGSDALEYIVVWNKPKWLKRGLLRNMPKGKSLLFIWDSPVDEKKLYARRYLRHFKRIYTWDDDLVDNKRFHKLYFPALRPMLEGLPSFQERKFLAAVFANKKSKHPNELYSEADAAVRFFEEKPAGTFDLYGEGWDLFANYRGAAEDPAQALKNYRFSLCYENTKGMNGYVTEKIFNSFAAGCVPVYWGASNIEKYIPAGCYIDRRNFQSNEELFAFLKSLNEADYEKYLGNIRSFLESDQALVFSKKMFEAIFLDAVHFP